MEESEIFAWGVMNYYVTWSNNVEIKEIDYKRDLPNFSVGFFCSGGLSQESNHIL